MRLLEIWTGSGGTNIRKSRLELSLPLALAENDGNETAKRKASDGVLSK